MTDTRPTLTRLVYELNRCTQAFASEAFGKYGLSSGTYPYLLMLSRNEGISQNCISKELKVDKAMSARAVKKLISLGYVKREEDSLDSRAYKLYLTQKARDIIPELRRELKVWNEIIAEGLDGEDREKVFDLISKVLDNAKGYKRK